MSGCPVSPPQGAHKLLKNLARIQRPLGLSQEYVSNQLTWNVNLAKFLDAPGGFFQIKADAVLEPLTNLHLLRSRLMGRAKPHWGT